MRSLFPALSALVTVWSTGCSSAPEPKTGHEAREELVALVREAETELSETRDQIRATMDRYNFLMSRTSNDPVAAYEDFARSLERTTGRVESLGGFLQSMEADSSSFFTAWERDFDQYDNEELKRVSQERLHGCRKRYGGIRTAMAPARARTDQFLANLNDQMLFLRYEMSPAAVKFLSRDAALMNRSGKELVGSLEEAIQASQLFVQSMSVHASAAKGGASDGEAESSAAAASSSKRKASAKPASSSATRTSAPKRSRSSTSSSSSSKSGASRRESPRRP